MAINNIDSQFATARAEVRALIKHCKADTNIGGRSIMVLQSIVDTLDAIQKDSYESSESFHRLPVTVDPPTLTKPDFKLSAGLDKKDRKLLEEMRQTDRLC
tara:strand:+ start:111 stop:413 length:303 start_codon:yes stop_codon:yes gene_type:complete